MDKEIELSLIKRRSVEGIASLLLRMVFLQLVVLVASIFVSRFLTPFAFGVYGMVANFVLLFAFFSDIGLAAALVQKKEKITREDLTTTFTIQQFLVGVLVVFVILILPLAQRFFGFGEDGLWLGRVLAFSLLLASLKSIPSVLLERQLKFNLLVVPEIIETLIFNFTLVYLAWQGWGIKSFTWAVLLRGISGLLAIYLLSPWRPGLGLDKGVAKRLLRFGLPFQANTIIAWFKDNLMDNVVAIILRSPVTFGYLSWARNLAFQPKKILDSVIRVSFPVYSRLQDQREILGRALSKTYFLLGVLMFPAMVGVCVLIKPLILYLYGGEKWLPAIPAVWFLSMTLLWGVLNSVATSALSAIGKIKTVLKFMVMVTVATWILTPIFTLRWGFNGAAFSWVLAGFTSLWSINQCLKEVKVNFAKDMGGALLASLVMGIIVWTLGHFWVSSLITLLAAVLAGVVIYGILIYWLEKERLISELKSFLGKKLNL